MPHNPPGGLRSVFSTFRTPFCMLVGILKRMGSYFCKQKQIDFSLSLHTPKSIHIPIFTILVLGNSIENSIEINV